jgi:hypothetical protein
LLLSPHLMHHLPMVGLNALGGKQEGPTNKQFVHRVTNVGQGNGREGLGLIGGKGI